MDEPNQPGPRQRQQKSRKKIWLLSILIITVVAVAGFLIFKMTHQTDGSQLTQELLTEEKNSVDFPLYYPTSVPKGFSLQEDSISNQEEAVFITYYYGGGKKMVVTQQARPRLMEEVKKVKQFDTPAGKAYIADLNGNTTGFILTDETLVIISNADKNDVAVLEEFMRGFKTLN